MNAITLSKVDGNWMATFSGPASESVFEAFGTRTIPTPFFGEYSVESMVRQIGSQNPGHQIVVK